MSLGILFPTNEYATSSKSPEEIQKLTLTGCKSVEDVLAHIVSKGTPLQMPFLYTNMQRAYKLALGPVCEKAPTESPENQILIASSLKMILEKEAAILTMDELERIFETCLECLNNLQSAANEEMGSVLELTIKLHPASHKLLKRLEEVALDLGKPAQPIISKVTSGRLISILAKYTRRNIKGEMVDILKRILADSEIEAKKVWLSEIFPRLLQNMNLQFIELHLQEKIYECVWDENEEIGIMALQVILKNAIKFSIEEQSSRIVKLFIDSLTSKKEKISVMASELMGEAYQKLINIILKNETNCIRFWKSLIELSQSKNQRILNNLIYNLPGILILAAPLHRVDPICDIYIELFYEPLTDKLRLAAYFHEMVKLFPSKWMELKEIALWMFQQLFEDADPMQDNIRILLKIFQNLGECKLLFLVGNQQQKDERREEDRRKYFDLQFCDNLMKFLNLLLSKKNSGWLTTFYSSLKECCDCFSSQFTEQTLLPKLFACLKAKTPSLITVIQIILTLIIRDGNAQLINNYTSKISTEFIKSTKSHERETALLFFSCATQFFSIERFQEYKLGEKFLSFNNDKNFLVKATFIRFLPRLFYYFTREEKLEYTIILSRFNKDSDPEIIRIMEGLSFIENEQMRKQILEKSQQLKEIEDEKNVVNNTRRTQPSQLRRSSKDIKVEVIKKRVETTKGKNKIVIKELPKKKIGSALAKVTSSGTYNKNS